MIRFHLFLLGGCLKANPDTRMTISDILERLAAISESMGYDLKEPLNIEGKRVSSSANHSPSHGVQNEQMKPSKPAQPSRPPPPAPSSGNAPQRPEPPLVR